MEPVVALPLVLVREIVFKLLNVKSSISAALTMYRPDAANEGQARVRLLSVPPAKQSDIDRANCGLAVVASNPTPTWDQVIGDAISATSICVMKQEFEISTLNA